MTDTVRVTETTALYMGLPEGHVDAHVEQAVEALTHKAKTEYGATFSLPLKACPSAHISRLIEKDGFTARYTQIYDIESGKLISRVDMLLPTAMGPA